jgi:hypothetical protein
MLRAVDLLTLFVFLIAVAGNCVQASQVTLDPIAIVLDESDSSEGEDSEFLLADDKSDDTASPLVVESTRIPIDAVLFSVTFPIPVAVAVQLKRSTVLRL